MNEFTAVKPLHLTSPLIGMWFLQRSPSGGLRFGSCRCFAQLMSNQMLLDFVKGYWWAGRGSRQSLGFPGGKRMGGWREKVNEWKKNVFFAPAVWLCDPKHLFLPTSSIQEALSVCLWAFWASTGSATRAWPHRRPLPLSTHLMTADHNDLVIVNTIP